MDPQVYISDMNILGYSHFTSVIDIYTKCGCIEMALHLFEKMVHKNFFTWNTILSGLAMNGFGGRVIEYYDAMIRSVIVPNKGQIFDKCK